MAGATATAAAPGVSSEDSLSFWNLEYFMSNMFYSVVDYFNPATLPGAVVYALIFLALPSWRRA